jgi:hypothetical protein
LSLWDMRQATTRPSPGVMALQKRCTSAPQSCGRALPGACAAAGCKLTESAANKIAEDRAQAYFEGNIIILPDILLVRNETRFMFQAGEVYSPA